MAQARACGLPLYFQKPENKLYAPFQLSKLVLSLDMSSPDFLKQISQWPCFEQADLEVEQMAARLSKGDKGLQNLLIGVMENSSYLRRLLEKHPEQIDILIEYGPDGAIGILCNDLTDFVTEQRADFARHIRQIKEKYHLCLALLDLGGVWDTARVISEFSDFADKMINHCLQYSWTRIISDSSEGTISLYRDTPLHSSGLFIIGFGKLGGLELNYSSDIDLVFFWDPLAGMKETGQQIQRKIILVARDMVSLLSEISEYGYVFRVDLRLRPDPSSTPIVLTIAAALTYYESVGQTWERSAWIKARFIAGDKTACSSFLHQMEPFIWRRNLDYSTIDDVHQIRHQIFFGPNQPRAPDAGYNVKLGVGGIREIELFAQTLQLIHAGRITSLRQKNTVQTLRTLAAENLISEQIASNLTKHYFFLRRVENALQMRNDLQTHDIPADSKSKEQLQNLLGYKSEKHLDQDLTVSTKEVAQQTNEFFGQRSSDNASDKLHLFALDDHPEAIELLQQAGFTDPSVVLQRLRSWMTGRIRATQSQRSRKLLAKLSAELIEAFTRSENPDKAFASFASFLEALPAGVQILSLFANCPGLLVRVVDIFQLAPRLGEIIALRPSLVEVLLAQDPFQSFSEAQIWQNLRLKIARSDDLERAMDEARRQVQEARFVIGSQLLTGHADPCKIAMQCSGLATNTITALAGRVIDDMAAKIGPCPVDWAILGLGSMGSREMNPASDIDLMVVYREKPIADFEQPLDMAADIWAARFTRRLISALSAPTAEGLLYEVDMKLRPSGKSGPISVEFSAFGDYYRRVARIWEFQALCRARTIAASCKKFDQKLTDNITHMLANFIDSSKLRPSIIEMRDRLFVEKPPLGVWDIKRGAGGLTELEFVWQALILLSPQAKYRASLFDYSVEDGLPKAETKISNEQFRQLKSAHSLFHRIQQIITLAIGRIGCADELPPSLSEILLSSCKQPSIKELEQEIIYKREQVATVFAHIIEK